MKQIIAAAIVALIPGTSLAAGNTDHSGTGDRYVGAPFATRAPVIAQHGMAATAQPLATQVAIDILKAGGSAVDAAIAANAALGLMEPVSNGIGGDLFAIVWDPKTKKLYGYNGSGRSAMGRSYAQMQAKLHGATHIPKWGSLPITVPGTVDGWGALHDRFGNFRWRRTSRPRLRMRRTAFRSANSSPGIGSATWRRSGKRRRA